jgi:site-specific recombinase XerD
MQLLINEKLARMDIVKIKLRDFTGSQLSIAVEGSSRSKIIALSTLTRKSIQSWVKLRPQIDNQYLFVRLSQNKRNINTNLSERGVYQIIKNIGEAANLNCRLNVRSIFASLK